MGLPTVCLLMLAAAPQVPAEPRPAPTFASKEFAPVAAPVVEVEIVKVVDGDTLDVRLDGAVVPLRLLSVDTEEKISGHPLGSPTKPQTVFGQETADWARAFFAALGTPPRVGLTFPEGRRFDVFGRLLCHVRLPDGRDYNRLLVELGKSPYFTKYGNSLVDHAGFVHAQAAARAAQLGLWNPATNRPRSPDAPAALRPYAELLPWWDARAAAIEAFRSASARDPDSVVSHEDPAGLRRALERCQRDAAARVTIFGAIERFYDETDGSLTVLLRAGEPDTALRATVPADQRAELEPFLRSTTAEFVQNYLYVTGRLTSHARGFLLHEARRADWRLAEPAYGSGAARERER
jgi:micrococcal nuclease